MKFTEQEYEALLRENAQLRDEVAKNRREIEARNRLFDTLTEGSSDIAVLVEGGSRKVEYVSRNVESVLGIASETVMNDLRELGQNSGSEIGAGLHLQVGESMKDEVSCLDRIRNISRKYYRSVTRIGGTEEDVYLVIYIDAEKSAENKMQKILSLDSDNIPNRLLAGMSHDLRTSLNSVVGNVLLQMKNPQDPVRVMDYAHRISMSCQDLLSTVNQILDMSNLESGEIALQENEFALGSVIEEVTDIITNSAQMHHQHFEVTVHGLEHDLFIGDKARIMEILVNLLSNAVKYTAEGGSIELVVSGKSDADPEYMDLSFEVKDNGIGMSSELQKRLFESASRDAERTVPGMIGSGLGVKMVRKLVSFMGGTISVQSTLGSGSTVVVGLRLKKVSAGTDGFWTERRIQHVLIAFQDMNEAARICGLLKKSGLDVDYTSSGYGTLQVLEQAHRAGRSYEVILIDRDLQDMSYGDLVSNIHGMGWKRSPIVVLMSDKDVHFLHPVKKKGITGIIPKPFFFSTFKQFIETQGILGSADRKEAPVDPANPLSGLRFLMAEDNTINADILKELLELEGARCEIAGNGRAALAMFHNSKPNYYDMILMDIQMPVMNGYDATRAIRKLSRADAKTVPILAMTADALDADVQKAFDSGMDAHIPKPINVKLLNNTIRNMRK